jgi:hypothetical protein
MIHSTSLAEWRYRQTLETGDKREAGSGDDANLLSPEDRGQAGCGRNVGSGQIGASVRDKADRGGLRHKPRHKAASRGLEGQSSY